jgi:L-fucose mutarotase
MLLNKLIHPEILAALGAAGHGSQILIADGNYPFSTGTSSEAKKVFLNLMPGVVTVTQVLEALLSAVPVEAAHVMLPAEGAEPGIFQDFRNLLPDNMSLNGLGRFEFYAAARTSDVALVIATADQRLYANLLLTIGVRPPG